jgi:histone H1/5
VGRHCKKYIAANYKVDSQKLSPFIKKYLKTAVASGELVQAKGKGASGSFRLAGVKPERTAVIDAPPRGNTRSSGPKEEKKFVKTKPNTPKKVPEKKKAASPAKGKKLPSKVKVTKVPTKKPKAPRPRTAAKSKPPKKSSPKK